MVKMIIDRPLILLTDDRQRVAFKAGAQDVPDVLAGHWYVKANGSIVADDAPAGGSEAVGGEGESDQGADEGEAAAETTTDDRAALIVEASRLGVTVDGRWSIERVKQAIAAAKAKAQG